MAYSVPIRGGVDPAAATDTTLWTQTTGKSGVVFVTANNRTAAPINIRVAVRPLGAAIADTDYDLFDFPLSAFDSVKRGPFSLLATDVITVRASAVDVTFRFDGFEEA